METLRRGDEDEVGQRNGVLVSFEADELIAHRNVHLTRMLRLEDLQTLVQTAACDVRHRDELRPLVDIQVLVGCARAAPPAADERNLHFI